VDKSYTVFLIQNTSVGSDYLRVRVIFSWMIQVRIPNEMPQIRTFLLANFDAFYLFKPELHSIFFILEKLHSSFRAALVPSRTYFFKPEKEEVRKRCRYWSGPGQFRSETRIWIQIRILLGLRILIRIWPRCYGSGNTAWEYSSCTVFPL
jgi:hypothetical protein